MSGQMPYFMGNKNRKLLVNETKSRNSSKKTQSSTRSVKGMSSWFTIKPHTLKYKASFTLMLHSEPII